MLGIRRRGNLRAPLSHRDSKGLQQGRSKDMSGQQCMHSHNVFMLLMFVPKPGVPDSVLAAVSGWK